MALAPAIFNISEPITFGLPIILKSNLFYSLYYCATIVFLYCGIFTKIGFIPVVCNNVPWTVPPIISGILFTGTIAGGLVQLINLVISMAIYYPFVKIADKMELDKMTETEKLEAVETKRVSLLRGRKNETKIS